MFSKEYFGLCGGDVAKEVGHGTAQQRKGSRMLRPMGGRDLDLLPLPSSSPMH